LGRDRRLYLSPEGISMDLYETLMKRRSVRSFEDRPVPDDVVDKLVAAANNAAG
jgi:nitroreductase